MQEWYRYYQGSWPHVVLLSEKERKDLQKKMPGIVLTRVTVTEYKLPEPKPEEAYLVSCTMLSSSALLLIPTLIAGGTNHTEFDVARPPVGAVYDGTVVEVYVKARNPQGAIDKAHGIIGNAIKYLGD